MPPGLAGVAFDPINCKSLYVGNLHPYVNEQMLQEIFKTLGPVVEVKVIKDRVTGMSAGYGFVTFTDHRCADLALQCFNGRVLYGQEVRVNWAFQKDQREDTSSHFHTFVGDLSSEVNDRLLFEAFAERNSGCSDARVMWDHNTGRSKGYGFVSFRSQEEAEAAIAKMNGEFIGHRRVRCGWAQHKQDQSQATDFATVDKSDPFNTNVYVGNVSPELNDSELRRAFSHFGNVLEVKTYRKGSYGFVQYQLHEEAVRAIIGMNGQKLRSKPLKCSWGRHQNRGSRNAMPMAGNLLGLPQLSPLAPAMLGQNLGPLLRMPQNLGLQQQPMLPQLQATGPQLGMGPAGPSLPGDSALAPLHTSLYQGTALGPDSSTMLGPYGPYYGQ